MSTNRLRSGLRDFITAIDRQQAGMRDQGERLEMSWRRTRDVYSGEGAEVFAQAFEQSMAMLRSYMEVLDRISPLLRSRLEALDRHDSGSHPEP